MPTEPLTFLFNLRYIDPNKTNKRYQSNYDYLEQIYQSVLFSGNRFKIKPFKRFVPYDPSYAVKTYDAGQHVIRSKDKPQNKNKAIKKQNQSNQTKSNKHS